MPSQPGTPGQSSPPTQGSPAPPPQGSPALPPQGSPAASGDNLPPTSSVELGVQQLVISDSPRATPTVSQTTPTVSESLIPAPVTVVRSTPSQNHTHLPWTSGQPPSALPPSSLPGQQFTTVTSQVAPPTSDTSSVTTPSLQSAGLPLAPPTISLPTMAPTISLGPAPSLTPASST